MCDRPSPARRLSMKTITPIDNVWAQHRYLVAQGMDFVSTTAMSEAAEILVDAARQHHPIFVAGNGASAALSQHWACDHLKGSSSPRYSNHVISLASNMALITAIGNDYGYERVFTEQLARHTQPHTSGVVVLISASGKSPNIIHVAEFARTQRRRLKVISLTGFMGEPLRGLSTVNLHVPIREYEAVEDVHNAIMHLFAKVLRAELIQTGVL